MKIKDPIKDPNNLPFYDSCTYNKLIEDEKQKSKPKKSTPMQLIIQQQFLKDQGKTKRAEQIWFDKLEDELDRIEMDEALLKFRDQSSKQSLLVDQIRAGEDGPSQNEDEEHI